MKRLAAAVTLVLVAVASAALAAPATPARRNAARPTTTPSGQWSEFDRRVRDYLALHRRAADTVPSDAPTDDAGHLVERRKALGSAIRSLRPNAARGDVFTARVEHEIRRITRADLAARPPADRAAVRQDVPRLPFAVNDEYPDDVPLATSPPRLLANLPTLPEELEYRFFDRHLILLDVDANLIVDYIPNAIPPSAS